MYYSNNCNNYYKNLYGASFSPLHPRYLFELGRRHTSVPDIFLGKLYDASEKVIRECCSAKDVPACLDSKVTSSPSPSPSAQVLSVVRAIFLCHAASADGWRAASLPGKGQPALRGVQQAKLPRLQEEVRLFPQELPLCGCASAATIQI